MGMGSAEGQVETARAITFVIGDSQAKCVSQDRADTYGVAFGGPRFK